MAMNHSAIGVVSLLLMMILTPWQQSTCGVAGVNSSYVETDDMSTTNSSSRMLAALNYPNIQIGPYTWRYFRIEVPRAFAELNVLLTRKWTGEQGGKQKAKVPMVCFRVGSPPLPDLLLESPQAAAMAAAKAGNSSRTGCCAWFLTNSSISLTNMQIPAGLWYVGVFSDPEPGRFQAKMITRGSTFTFGVHFTVSGCKTPNLRGRDCDVAVKSLYFETPPISSIESGWSQKRLHNQETILTKTGTNLDVNVKTMPDLIHQSNGVGDKEENAWTSLTSQRVDVGAWKYFALEVDDFALSLQIRAVCMSPNCGAGIGTSLYLSHGALPDDGDNGTVMDSPPITVSAPRRGLWYVGVRNPTTTSPLDFDLHWRVESCAVSTISMERVLVDEWGESPFNSYYGPAGGDSLIHSPWFSLSEVAPVGTTSPKNWTFFFMEVPRGASGAVLSVKLRHGVHATSTVYARWEGLATLDNWDVKVVNSEEKGDVDELSLDLVYPAEGIWCIGVHYVKEFEPVHETSADFTQRSSRFFLIWKNTTKSIAHWYENVVECLGAAKRSLWRIIGHNKVSEKFLFASAEADMIRPSGPAPATQPSTELSSERQDAEAQMHISVHGCLNHCSGRGRCVTGYESSRLHFYSYCHCDAAHGGIDCSVPLLVPTDETVQIWTLVGSNFAALLPSYWAMQHQGYSEWMAFTASGAASGFYHSCDAGGWCALKYDTLQVDKLLYINNAHRNFRCNITIMLELDFAWVFASLTRDSNLNNLLGLATQFLDFWLAFLVVIVTCVEVASLKQNVKAVAHVGFAIVTAAITKEDATRLESIHRFGEQLLHQLKGRFRWGYLIAGLGILCTAGLSWVLEAAETYWIWHSLWHVSIYTSAFLILCSTATSAWPPERRTLSPQASTDAEAVPMLRHTVELDAFAGERGRRDD
uniref:EGF-like domain-containing protein n=1 Tax=Physcomitrium patens TaxID=3218 RepID=A0A7I3ZYL1_PHYPA